MATKYKKSGYVIEVGDVIEVSLGSNCVMRHDVVTRVTKTLAICEKKNHKVPTRYPRIVKMSFSAIPYNRSTVMYRVLDNDN